MLDIRNTRAYRLPRRPHNPKKARRAGIEGTVTLSITIAPEGQVVAAKIISGPGYGLNEAARHAIKRFRFKPAIKGGEPVSTEMKYSYTFVLD